MKGIILAGGSGTRLFPSTISVSKQLLPIYDKPMIYYPISLLMLIEVRDILIITTPEDSPMFKKLLGDGSQWGINLTYATQDRPNGLAEAFIIGKEFIGDSSVALILGDNVFYGHGLPDILISAKNENQGGTVFGYYVDDPNRYGVVEFDKEYNVVSIEEKPDVPKSNYAIPGIYFFDNRVSQKAFNVKPSARGELEIVDVINDYFRERKLKVKLFGRGVVWFDTGTHQSLLEASNFVASIENRQGLKISCLEEIAYNKKYISKEEVLKTAATFKNSSYGKYLTKLVES